MYSVCFKRILDFSLSLIALLLLSPVLLVFIIIGAIVFKGNPFFLQVRPGKKDKNGNEKFFKIIKLRTMLDITDENGNMLPDEDRLTPYGAFLRNTSIDELTELINIIKGDMAIVGPRPQLVKDLVFMTEQQRKRHNIRPGLTGLAQINGRNALEWEKKFDCDVRYVETVSFMLDVKIIVYTVKTVFEREGILGDGIETGMDYGDHLLRDGFITQSEYDEKTASADKIAARV